MNESEEAGLSFLVKQIITRSLSGQCTLYYFKLISIYLFDRWYSIKPCYHETMSDLYLNGLSFIKVHSNIDILKAGWFYKYLINSYNSLLLRVTIPCFLLKEGVFFLWLPHMMSTLPYFRSALCLLYFSVVF